MGSKIHFRCAKCGYESRELVFDNEVSVFACPNCREMVNASFVRYRFAVSPCPLCEGRLRRSDWEYSKSRPEETCPRCQAAWLECRELLHFVSEYPQRPPPEPGEVVQGFYRGKLAVQLANSLLVAKLVQIPDLPPDTPVECEVIGVDNYVNVRLVRQLSLDEF